jgi:cytochrome P450
MTEQVEGLTAFHSDADGKQTVNFNHHSPAMLEHSHEIFAELRNRCPVAWTDQLGGFWVVSGYQEVTQVSRDDETFSSENDHVTRLGVAQPPMPHWAGLVEMDPPEFTPLRKALVPWFSPKAATDRTAITQTITDYVIDQFIERGSADLTEDLAVPIPALLTMDLVGFPFSESGEMADLFHRHTYTPPGTPERARLNAEVQQLSGLLHERAAERRAKPTEDLLSYLANIEIGGELLSLEEIAGHAFLVLIGGIDTTTALLSNTFIHLQRHPEERARLLADTQYFDSAFNEYMRFYTPVQGLARTVTRDCFLGSQHLKENDRVWLSWAAANLDEKVFEEAETVRLDRAPNRHVGFGVGIHRCLGANIAQVTWRVVTRRVLERLGDYVLDVGASVPFPTIGTGAGWLRTPATFTPGARLGVELPRA